MFFSLAPQVFRLQTLMRAMGISLDDDVTAHWGRSIRAMAGTPGEQRFFRAKKGWENQGDSLRNHRNLMGKWANHENLM